MITKAKLSDAKEIQALINSAAEKKQVLEHCLNNIYENIRDFWICRQQGRITGCCGLHLVGWQSLAEVKSLVVAEEFRKKGLGVKLVRESVEEARKLGAERIFALTFVPVFFQKQGFRLIDKNSLPHKIWTDCINCKYFPDCREEAVIIEA